MVALLPNAEKRVWRSGVHILINVPEALEDAADWMEEDDARVKGILVPFLNQTFRSACYNGREVTTMSARSQESAPTLLVRNDRPLIGVMSEEDGQDVVRYFVDEQAADAASGSDSIQRALNLAGAWDDLDWDEMERALDQIRHESEPTPPISEL